MNAQPQRPPTGLAALLLIVALLAIAAGVAQKSR